MSPETKNAIKTVLLNGTLLVGILYLWDFQIKPRIEAKTKP